MNSFEEILKELETELQIKKVTCKKKQYVLLKRKLNNYIRDNKELDPDIYIQISKHILLLEKLVAKDKIKTKQETLI